MTGSFPQEELSQNCTECRDAIPLGEREIYFVPSGNGLGFSHGSGQVLCLRCGEELIDQYKTI